MHLILSKLELHNYISQELPARKLSTYLWWLCWVSFAWEVDGSRELSLRSAPSMTCFADAVDVNAAMHIQALSFFGKELRMRVRIRRTYQLLQRSVDGFLADSLDLKSRSSNLL